MNKSKLRGLDIQGVYGLALGFGAAHLREAIIEKYPHLERHSSGARAG